MYTPDTSKPPAVIIDIDGTVALHPNRGPYDESLVNTDTPNMPVIISVRAMIAAGHQPIFLSGRTDGCRDATFEWLQQYFADTPFLLYMRKAGDKRPDFVIKEEIFNGFIRDEWNVICAYDDRDQIVKLWRSIGLCCLQVNYGDF